MVHVLISACLMGVSCRYDGKNTQYDGIDELMARVHLVPVCAETLGGLPTPRIPAERVGDRVLTQDGRDVTEAYQKGAEEALRIARRFGCAYAILKERSPSCGNGTIYDGTFTKTLVPGDGVTAALLRQNGIRVFGESQIPAFLAMLDAKETVPV